MRRIKIQLSRAVGALFILATTGLLSLHPGSVSAQCGTGTLQKVTYTNTFIGTGGFTYPVTIPQFNPTGGQTLMSAVYSSVVSTSANIGFLNTTASPIEIFPTVSRQDVVKVNGSLVQNANVTSTETEVSDVLLGPNPMPSDFAGFGGVVVYSSTQTVYDSITNAGVLAATYTGAGNNSVTYANSFFLNSVPASVTTATAFADTIKFSVTYYYCQPYILAANFLSFTATRENTNTALLKWSTTNEEAGRTYDVEVSQTGSDFSTFGSLPSSATGSDANYSYDYNIPAGATGKLYFRIKQIDLDGSPSYSVTCVVNLDGGGTAFSIFPNPATSFVSLTLPGGNQNWQVDIIAADGNLVQRNAFSNTSLATVNFARKLASGVYFVRATNTNSAEQHVASFVIPQ